jgi:biotin carboxylase
MITNRGEIARRVMRTCKALGVPTLGVYTKPDALAPHVREADYAVCLGDNPREYTNKALLLEIAREHAVTAIHPGQLVAVAAAAGQCFLYQQLALSCTAHSARSAALGHHSGHLHLLCSCYHHDSLCCTCCVVLCCRVWVPV